MSVITTNLRCELQEPVKVQYLNGNLFSQDVRGNVINVAVFDNDAEASLSGSTVSGNVVRADGNTVVIDSGNISGNVASITLPAEAYYIPGVIQITIKLTTGSTITTIASVVSNVYRSSTDTIVDPGTIIPSIQTLIDTINTALEDIPPDYLGEEVAWEIGAESTAQKYADGGDSSSSKYDRTKYVFLGDYSCIRYTRPVTTGSSSTSGMAFFRNVTTSTYISGQQVKLSGSADGYEDTLIAVPDTARYARFSVLKSDHANFKIYGYTSSFELVKNAVSGLSATCNAVQDLFYNNAVASPSFVQGSYHLTAFDHATNRARTNYIDIRYIDSVSFTVASGYKTNIAFLDSDLKFVSETGFSTDSPRTPSHGNLTDGRKYMIVTVGKNDDSDITTAEAATAVTFTIKLAEKYIYRSKGAVYEDYAYTALSSCTEPGWYKVNASTIGNITDKPDNLTSAAMLIVWDKGASDSQTQMLIDGTHGKIWIRRTGSYGSSWTEIAREETALQGKKVAILGASNDTHGNPGTSTFNNVAEIEVMSEDVSVEGGLSMYAYVTYYDIGKTLHGEVTIDGVTTTGHTIVSEDVGKEITFVPTAEDIGTYIGVPATYAQNSNYNVWWMIAAKELGFTPIPVCWSGASISSHQGTTNNLKTSYAWHDAQIRKCGVRTPGSMTRTPPDVVIIARGLNDYSHNPITVLTDNYFGSNYNYPETDEISTGVYGFYEALALTIKKIRAAYPLAQIVLCTMKMAMRTEGNAGAFPPRNGTNTIIQYSEAFRKAADFFGCHLIEFDKCGITYENFVENYCYDKGTTTPSHANQAGHNLMGHRAIIDLQKLNF